jgi:hypothetical protein
MSTTISLLQAALVLGVSMQETARLVRARRLSVAHVVRKVKYVTVESVRAYIASSK